MKTKNEVKNPVSNIGFKEVLAKKKLVKLSANQSKQIDELMSNDSFNEAILLLEKFEKGIEDIEFTYEFNDDGLTIKIPKHLLGDLNNFTNSKGEPTHYSTVYSFQNNRQAKILRDGSNLAMQIGIINYKELTKK